ncbi:MAG TPA: hypothetical protein PKV94_07685 [Syntrophales bacterium]|nr:hypothetical protein [Syntrophales bacterium]HPN24870.1 hypothetical protein [Syntrophales bacterium]
MEKTNFRGREWLYIVGAGNDPERSGELTLPIFGAWKLRRGDTVYLFRPVKNGSVLFGSLAVQDEILDVVRRSRGPEVVIGGSFKSHVQFKTDVKGDGLRPFDYAAFMEKVCDRRSVRDIVRFNATPAAIPSGGCCRIFQFGR